MAAPSTRLQRLVLPLVGAAALLVAASPLQGQLRDASTATVVSNVKKPRPVKRSIHKAGRASKPAVQRVAKRPAKAAPKRPAEPSRPRIAAQPTPNDPLWSTSWSLTRANVPAAWSLTPGVAETVVAVLDTGVDLAHPDLQGSLVQGYDAVNRDDDPTDDHGHGTMVAGVVAARGNNGLGGVGVCSGCSVMPVKVIAGNGSGTAADIADGIRWATEHGADIVNMSFTLSGPDEGVAQAIAFAQSRGVVVVAAAGNAGVADVSYPAGYPGVVSVAGSDSADVRYGWSNYGGWVRLAAPGCSVSTAAGGSYGEFCGTSSATAFVSGVAGLIRSLAPELPADGLGQALAAGAVPVGDFVSAGRVDVGGAAAALRQAAPAPSSTVPPPLPAVPASDSSPE